MTELHNPLSKRSVDTVLRKAWAAGLSPVLIAILADPGEPEVARLRAYGRLTARLDSLGHVSVRRSPAA